MKSLGASEKLGLPRYVAHQAYYALCGRDFEQELMPLGVDQGVGTVVWSAARLGPFDGQESAAASRCRRTAGCRARRSATPGRRSRTSTLYDVVDALDAVAGERSAKACRRSR